VRRITLLMVICLTLLAAAVTPWPRIQQAISALMPPDAAPGPCPALAPTPDYYAAGGEKAAIEAINHARAREGLAALTLPSDYWQLAPPQQQFILVNLERASRELSTLRWDATLAQIATAYSRQMAQLGFFAHTSPISGNFPTRLDANPQVAGHYQSIAENIAGNWAPAAGAVYEYLYNDAAEGCAHRRNLLNPVFTLIGIGVAPGGPWRMMSAQELLAPNPANPYTGAAPDTTPPGISLSSALSASATQLRVSANAHDNQGIARVIWYLDGLGHLCHQGTSWTLDTAWLAPGTHHLTVYAVDESQNYATATLGFSIGPQGITLAAAS